MRGGTRARLFAPHQEFEGVLSTLERKLKKSVSTSKGYISHEMASSGKQGRTEAYNQDLPQSSC